MGITLKGITGLMVSACRAVAKQSVALCASPTDSNTVPKLYLKNKFVHHLHTWTPLNSKCLTFSYQVCDDHGSNFAANLNIFSANFWFPR